MNARVECFSTANGTALTAPIRLDSITIGPITEKNVDAMVSLGWQYANGNGVPQDFAAARKWFESAADTAGPAGHFEVAGLYSSGRGVGSANPAEAVRHPSIDCGDSLRFHRNPGELRKFKQGE